MTGEGYHLGPSPSWYLSGISDCSEEGLFAYGAQNSFVVIDVNKSPPIYKLMKTAHKDKITCLAFGRPQKNACNLAVGGRDKLLQVWDVGRLEIIHEHTFQQGIQCVEWQYDSDNLLFVIDDSGAVLSWNVHHKMPYLIRHGIRSPASALASWPYNNRYLAVGFKGGLIAVLNVSKGGEPTYKLKGHEDEIISLSWNLVDNDNKKTSFQRQMDTQELLSTSKDRTLRSWNLDREKYIQLTKPPQSKKLGPQHAGDDKKSKQWLVAKWKPNSKVQQALCSGPSGELLLVCLGKKKLHWESFDTREIGGHQRCIFSISTFGNDTVITVSLDRQIIIWDMKQMKSVFVLPTLGGFAYCMAFSPLDIGRLAVGVGDSTIRIWNTVSSSSPYSCQSFWQGIKGKVTALCWHPDKEGWLGFGTEEGRVGVLDLHSNKPPVVSSSHHRNQIYSLSWGPCGQSGKQSFFLYSCGDEVIRIHDTSKPDSEALDLDSFVGNKGLKGYTEISWKPDWTAVALGHKDGLVEIYSSDWNLLGCLSGQCHLVQCLSWHPICTTLSPSSALHQWLAVSTYANDIYLYDLSSILGQNSPMPEIRNCSRMLSGHASRVTSVAWSPHLEGRLASVSYDGTTQIWDATSGQPLGNYQSQLGNGYSVAWSSHDPDILFSGSDDCSVHQFNLSRLIHKVPPTKKAKQIKIKKVKDVISGKEEISIDERKDEAKMDGNETAKPKLGGVNKKRTYRSLFPLSNSLENRNKVSTLADIQLLTNKCLSNETELLVEDSQNIKEQAHLAIFCSQPNIGYMLQQERGYHVEHGNLDCSFQLDIWKGDIVETLREIASKQNLTDFHISVANLASRELWLELCEKYALQLSLEGNFAKAATYLLTCHKVYEAIEMLRDQNMFKEAICIAKLRLPPDDPMLNSLISLWATKSEKDGNYELVTKCYLSLGDYASAAKILAKRSDPTSLRLAAYVATSSGLEAWTYAAQCVRAALLQKDYNVMEQLVQEQQSSLTGAEMLLLLSSTYKLLETETTTTTHEKPILEQFLVEMKNSAIQIWKETNPPFLIGIRNSLKGMKDCTKEALLRFFPIKMLPSNFKEVLFQTALEFLFSVLEEQDSEASLIPIVEVLHNNYNNNCLGMILPFIFHKEVVWMKSEEECPLNSLRNLYSCKRHEDELTPLQQSLDAFFLAGLLDTLLQEVHNLPSNIFAHCTKEAQLKQIEMEILAEISVAEKNAPLTNIKRDEEYVETSSKDLEKAKEECLLLLKEKLISMGMQCLPEDGTNDELETNLRNTKVEEANNELGIEKMNICLEARDRHEEIIKEEQDSTGKKEDIEANECKTVEDKFELENRQGTIETMKKTIALEEEASVHDIKQDKVKMPAKKQDFDISTERIKYVENKIEREAGLIDSGLKFESEKTQIDLDIGKKTNLENESFEHESEQDNVKLPRNKQEFDICINMMESKAENTEIELIDCGLNSNLVVKDQAFGSYFKIQNSNENELNNKADDIIIPEYEFTVEKDITYKDNKDLGNLDSKTLEDLLPTNAQKQELDDRRPIHERTVNSDYLGEINLKNEDNGNQTVESIEDQADPKMVVDKSSVEETKCEIDSICKDIINETVMVTYQGSDDGKEQESQDSIEHFKLFDSSKAMKESVALRLLRSPGRSSSELNLEMISPRSDQPIVLDKLQLVSFVSTSGSNAPDVMEESVKESTDQEAKFALSDAQTDISNRNQDLITLNNLEPISDFSSALEMNDLHEIGSETTQNVTDFHETQLVSSDTQTVTSDKSEEVCTSDKPCLISNSILSSKSNIFLDVGEEASRKGDSSQEIELISLNAQTEDSTRNQHMFSDLLMPSRSEMNKNEHCPGCSEVLEFFLSFMLTLCKGLAVKRFIMRQELVEQVRIIEHKIASALATKQTQDPSNRLEELQQHCSQLNQELELQLINTDNVPFPDTRLLSEKLLQMFCLLLPKISCVKAKAQLAAFSTQIQMYFS